MVIPPKLASFMGYCPNCLSDIWEIDPIPIYVLGTTLDQVLVDKPATTYPRLIWLDYFNPVWSRLKTKTEKESEKEKIKAILNKNYQLVSTQQLSGTMNIDKFTVNLYKQS